MKNIIIGIKGGIGFDIDVPEDVKVIIRDYDIDGMLDENVYKDDEGDYYQEIILCK